MGQDDQRIRSGTGRPRACRPAPEPLIGAQSVFAKAERTGAGVADYGTPVTGREDRLNKKGGSVLTAPSRESPTESEFNPVYHQYGPHRAGLPPLVNYFAET